MKTFAEATAAVSAKIPHKNGVPDLKAAEEAEERVCALVERMDELSREIAQSEFLGVLSLALMELVAAGEMSLGSALFTAFMNGVTIGMEMERSDDWAAGIDTKLSTKRS